MRSCLLSIARRSAVFPCASLMFGSAPWSSRKATVSAEPVRAAGINSDQFA